MKNEKINLQYISQPGVLKGDQRDRARTRPKLQRKEDQETARNVLITENCKSKNCAQSIRILVFGEQTSLSLIIRPFFQ